MFIYASTHVNKIVPRMLNSKPILKDGSDGIQRLFMKVSSPAIDGDEKFIPHNV